MLPTVSYAARADTETAASTCFPRPRLGFGLAPGRHFLKAVAPFTTLPTMTFVTAVVVADIPLGAPAPEGRSTISRGCPHFARAVFVSGFCLGTRLPVRRKTVEEKKCHVLQSDRDCSWKHPQGARLSVK